MKLVKIFPLFKDMWFCFPHQITVTLLDLTKEDTRYTVLLHTNYSVRSRNYQSVAETMN
jgi:hypothetical protein